MGKRNILARLTQTERDIKAQGIGYTEEQSVEIENPVSQAAQLTTEGQGADAGTTYDPTIPTRPNLFQNTGFESFDNGATTPKLWATTGTVALEENKDAITGTHVVQLTDGGLVSQQAPLGVSLPDCSIVVSVFARVLVGGAEGQTIEIEADHVPG